MSTKDLKFYDSEKWQSLSELAAAQVEPVLPISSADATVVLDSPSANTFTIETGGEERVKVSDTAATFDVDVQTPRIVGLAANNASIALDATITIDCNQFTPLTVTNNQTGVLIRTRNKDNRQYWHGQDEDGWAVCTRQTIGGVVQAVRSFGVTGDYELPDWRVYSGGFQADNWLKSPMLKGLADNNASIELGAGVTITTNAQELIVSGYTADYSGGTLCGLGASSNYIWSKADNGLAICADRIAFNSNVSGGAVGRNWLMETDGALVGSTGAGIEVSTISAGRNNAGDASIELGAELLTSNHNPTSPNAIATVQYVSDVLSGGGGGGGGTLPGNGANAYWQKVQIIQPLKKDSEPNLPVQEYGFMGSCDGIFTDGLHWSTDGENWNTSNPTLTRALFQQSTLSADYGLRIIKSPDEGLYYSPLGSGHYSYDMKTWTPTYRFQSPFYFDGKIRGRLGENYFDVTIPGSSTPEKAPKIPSNFINTPSYYKGMADNDAGDYAMAVLSIPTEGGNFLFLLSPDDGSEDWGWEPVTLPDEPFNVLFAKGKWWVFCSDKVYAIDDVASPGTATAYDLPVSANWDLVTFDGVSIVAANSTASVSVFLQGNSTRFKGSTNFVNQTALKLLSGTNGRTLFSMATGQVQQQEEVEEEDGSITTVTWTYDVREYYRTGIGNAFGNPDLIIGGGDLVQSGSVYLTEPIDTSENNTASGFPTWRSAAPDYVAPEPATLRTQEQTNSYFNNKISITRHDQNDLKQVVSGHDDAIAANAGLASDAMNVGVAAMAAASSNSEDLLEKTTVVVLSQAEYDALSPPDPEILYLIS